MSSGKLKAEILVKRELCKHRDNGQLMEKKDNKKIKKKELTGVIHMQLM
jgi:hypothetical protein